MFPTFAVFEVVFKSCTDDFGSMVIDNRKPSDNINEKIFWYKAIDPPDFHFGSNNFRKYHKEMYNKKWNKQGGNENKFDMGSFLKKKGTAGLNIEKV
jgi:hypothetical protein